MDLAKPTQGKPNQLEHTLSDGAKILFRRDIGEYAHEIRRGTGFKIDHYNIEIQTPGAKVGRFNSVENLHIVIDKNLEFVEAFTNKDGVLKMCPNYSISLNPDKSKEEEYEHNDRNLAEVRVQIPSGEIVSGSKYKVSITLSPDAMVGLGTELIRKGLKLKENDEKLYDYAVEHLEGIYSRSPCQKMGIYLTPKSCDLIVLADDLGKVEEIINKLEKK